MQPVTEERDILKKLQCTSQASPHEVRFILDNPQLWSMRCLCSALDVHLRIFSVVKAREDQEKIYAARTEARSDRCEYIEMFYDLKCRYGSTAQCSLVDYGMAYQEWVSRVLLVIHLTIFTNSTVSFASDSLLNEKYKIYFKHGKIKIFIQRR